MVRALMSHHGRDSLLSSAIGNGKKELVSLCLYSVAIPLAFLSSWIALAIYVTVACIWLVPDRRIETLFAE